MAIEVGTAYISILPSTAKLAPAIKRELATVEKTTATSGEKAGGGFASSFKRSVGTMLKGGLLAGVAGASLLAGAGLKTAAELEQSKIGFETMLGSAEKAEKFLNQIKKTAAKTPFELPGLTRASQRLLAFGFSAEEVIPTLTTLGDAAAGLGLGQEGMDRIIMAVGQMQAKGKVQGGEMLQLTEAGIPAAKILQNQLGMTADAYEEAQRKGKILATDAIPALLKGMKEGTKGAAGNTAAFGGLMDKQAQSLSGLFSTLKDTALVGMAEALDPLMPMLKTGLTGAINTVAPAMSGLASGIKTVQGLFQGGGGAMSSWSSSLSGLWSSVSGFVQQLMPTIERVAKQIMGALGPGLKSLGDVVKRELVPAFQRILPVVAPVAKFLISVLGGAVVGVIKGVVQALKGVVSIVSGVFNLISSLVTGDWAGAWDAVKQIFKGAIDFVIGAFKTWWNLGILAIFKRGALALLGGWRGLMNGLKSAPGKAFALINKAFMGGLKLVGRGITSAVKGYIGMWRSLFNFFRNLASAGWKALRSAFGGALAAVRTVISRAVSGYVNMWRALFTRLTSAAKSGMNLVKSGISKALEAIKTAFRNGVAGVKKIWDGLKKAASAPVRFVIDTVYNNGLRKMIGALPGVDTPSAVKTGFADGGWTGPGKKYQPAGIVHADEFVVSKDARRKFERENPGALDHLNLHGRLPGYATGGRVVWPAAGGVSKHSGYPWASWAGDINQPGDETGAPVRAYKDGVVSSIARWSHSYGNHIRLNHGGLNTLYAHLSSIMVGAGQRVTAGQQIGKVGNTGNSTGPHLHFEIAGGAAPLVSGGTTAAEKKSGGFGLSKWADAFSAVKTAAAGVKGSIGKLKGSGWAGLMGKSAKSMSNSLVQWINDKIPNKFLPDNPIPKIFDQGGVLEPGQLAYNASKRPEAVFNNKQFKSFAENAGGGAAARRTEFVITNWKTGEGYFREIAEDTYNGENEFAATIGRMK